MTGDVFDLIVVDPSELPAGATEGGVATRVEQRLGLGLEVFFWEEDGDGWER